MTGKINILTQTVKILKAFVIPFVGVIIGVVSFVYAQGIKSEREAAKKASIELKVDKLIKLDSLRTIKMDTIYDSQQLLLTRIDRLSGTMGIVKTQLGNHIIKTSNDKQDIINWFNATEEKKNNSTFSIR
jgi:cbb3-type cytochrome oxidase subunit 3